MELEDRYTGCLVAGAAGDALGYAVEFSSSSEIHEKYGPEGISAFKLSQGSALVSDDTQMTLFTASGLLNAKGTTMDDYVSSIWDSYKAWYLTQQWGSGPTDDPSQPLLKNEALFHRRAPGTTCLMAIKGDVPGSIEHPINDSKGCGGVMRVAPIGLYFALDESRDIEWIDMLGARAAALTHTHPLGYIAAAGLVHVVCSIVRHPEAGLGEIVQDMLEVISRLFQGSRATEAFSRLIQRAVQLAAGTNSDEEAIKALGEGWIAEETLAIAVYCALRYSDDVGRALRVSVNHDGDSDSTGSVTGNILGTLRGLEAVPEQYRQHLELADLLISMGSALYEAN